MSSTKVSSVRSKLLLRSPEWEFEQINFVVGNRGSVVESDFYTKLKKLDIQKGKADKLTAHQRLLKGTSSQVAWNGEGGGW